MDFTPSLHREPPPIGASDLRGHVCESRVKLLAAIATIEDIQLQLMASGISTTSVECALTLLDAVDRHNEIAVALLDLAA